MVAIRLRVSCAIINAMHLIEIHIRMIATEVFLFLLYSYFEYCHIVSFSRIDLVFDFGGIASIYDIIVINCYLLAHLKITCVRVHEICVVIEWRTGHFVACICKLACARDTRHTHIYVCVLRSRHQIEEKIKRL